MSPRIVCFILAVSIGCASFTRADEVPKPAAYVLKNKSTFTSIADDHRAPFWPIGWVKRRPMAVAAAATVRVVEKPKLSLDEKSFKVTSILLGDPSLAIVNGRTYSEGEFLRMPKPAPTLAASAAPAPRIRVFRINDGHVVLQYLEQLITVPLQRPELVQRSNVEELLSEDRP